MTTKKDRMNAIKLSIIVLPLFLFCAGAHGQSIGDKILRKAKQRVDRKIDRTIDKGLDEVEEGVDKTVTGEGGDDKKSAPQEKGTGAGTSGTGTTDEVKTGGKAPAAAGDKASFSTYSKFDFVPGEKIIAMEDFSQDAIGDFPARWNTDAGGEVMTIDGEEGHWLAFTTRGSLTPEFITELPENFTLEFDLLANPGYSYYDSPFWINLVERTGTNQFSGWKNYIKISLHPRDAGNGPFGLTRFFVFQDGTRTMQNDRNNMGEFNIINRNKARISIWRQNQRLRLYVNESKIWDLPKAFKAGAKYNGIVFDKENAKPGNNYFIRDLRLAVGAPDTRSKLLTEGKFSTTGIYFATNAAAIKPESNGVLKEIADVLQGNPEVKIRIVGHTDSDGDESHNLDLSKRRAEAVKKILTEQFNIDAGRMQTDGKGESQPADNNSTPAGKAANRRVEFIKM